MTNLLMYMKRDEIKDLYLQGFSSQEIKDKLKISSSVRSVQRTIKSMGISRSVPDAFRNAIKRNRVKFHYKFGKNLETTF